MSQEARKMSKKAEGSKVKRPSHIAPPKFGIPPEQALYGKETPLTEAVILTEKVIAAGDGATMDVFAEFEKS